MNAKPKFYVYSLLSQNMCILHNEWAYDVFVICLYDKLYDVIYVICELTYGIGIGIVMYDKLCLR